MSALAAVVLRDGRPVSEDLLARLSRSLEPFGPVAGEWRSGPAGLAKRARAHEEAFDQQLAAVAGGLTCLFDGFLSHRDDLAAVLGVARDDVARLSDSKLFALAWGCGEEDVALRADGEYLAVVWDAKCRTLKVLCSCVAAPPLYFHCSRDLAVVATAPRAIFAVANIARRIDDLHFAGWLAGSRDDSSASYWRGVRSLAPGESLTVTTGGEQVRRHYSLADHVEPVRLARTEDYLKAAEHHLHRAVNSAMQAAKTPAVMLSGGLDSQTLAVMAMDILAASPGAAPLLSLTSCPEPGWDGRSGMVCGDESDRVRALAEMYPALHARLVDAAGIDLDHRADDIMELSEVPWSHGNAHWIQECYRLAVADGRRTILTGDYGNATVSFAGWQRLPSLLRTGRWAALGRELASYPRRRCCGFSMSAAWHAVNPWLPSRLANRVRWIRSQGRTMENWTAFSPLKQEYARAAGVADRVAEAVRLGSGRSPRSCLEGRIQMVAGPIRLAGSPRSFMRALEVLYGTVTRAPFGDRRVVEWFSGVPDEQFMHAGRSRLLVRRMMKDRLPPEVLAAAPAEQGADWHLRVSRALPRIKRTLEGWRKDPAVAERLDLDRLLRLVRTWPAKTPLTRTDHPELMLARKGLHKALAAGRFIQWAERRR